MKAVSAVIVVILLLMISISLAGFAYFFFTGMVTTTTQAGTEIIEQTTSSMLAQMKVESIADNRIYIRNTGQEDLTSFSVYVDGEPVNISAPSSIAQGDVGSITIYGFINEGDVVRVTSGEGSIGSITSPDPCDSSSVVLCLKFDEGSETTARDSSGYGNDGTLGDGTCTPSVGNCPSWTTGKYGNALEFDGSNDYVYMDDDTSLRNFNEQTLEAWIYVRDLKYSGVISKWKTGARNYLLTVYPNRIAYFIRDEVAAIGDWAREPSSMPLPTNQWVHVVGVYSGSAFKIYRNGNLTMEEPTTAIIGQESTTIDIGRYFTGAYFNGTIDEVRIYNKIIKLLR